MERIVAGAGIQQVHHGARMSWVVNRRAAARGHGIRTGWKTRRRCLMDGWREAMAISPQRQRRSSHKPNITEDDIQLGAPPACQGTVDFEKNDPISWIGSAELGIRARHGTSGPVTARHLKEALAMAARWRAEVVILRLNTPGGLIDSTRDR